ncbi:RICIN domain-containing protein [Streptomyces sp. CG1]|uniref:RICIN domain-containing protein n=1 Tax=Streptomyces sp. CG1 TaxID=1287523 RepID=UPI0034E21AFF
MYTIAPGSCGAAVPAGQIQAAQPGFQQFAYCLDAHHGAGNGATVGLYPCTGNNNQQWQRRGDGLIASLGDSSLCVSGESTGLKLSPCNSGDPKQVWTYNRAGHLQANGLCADISGGALNDANAAVITSACGDHQPNQTWSAPFGTPPAP